jgi:hypothetical protein
VGEDGQGGGFEEGGWNLTSHVNAMSLRSFFCKSFGSVFLLVAVLPLVRFFNVSIKSGDTIDMILTGVASLFFIGLGVGLLIVSVDRTRTRNVLPSSPIMESFAPRNPKTVLIGLCTVGFMALAGIALTSFFHGDTDADQSGVRMLWWAVQRIGASLAVFGTIYGVAALFRPKPAEPRPTGDSQNSDEFRK